jgi:succinate dehydrogenase / fumarate reductase iron-sulfur subunit
LPDDDVKGVTLLMQVVVRILRFDPEKDGKPHWQEFRIEAEPNDRVLDLLHIIRDEHDGTLAFRRSCGHGICGSDAMVINGKNRLACKTLVKDLRQPITIEPLRGFRVIKDLVVDMEPFFAKYRRVMPYLINDEPPPKRNAINRLRSGNALTTRPNASFAPAARRVAPSSG